MNFPSDPQHQQYYGYPASTGAGYSGYPQTSFQLPSPYLSTPPYAQGTLFEAANFGSGGVGSVALNQLVVMGQQSFINKDNSWIYWPLKVLKPYFQVTHKYVIGKLGLVLFPFTRKEWKRSGAPQSSSWGTIGAIPVYQTSHMSPSESSLSVPFSLPKDDINSPDLYIPRLFSPNI